MIAHALGSLPDGGRVWASAQLLAVDGTINRAQVSIDGGAPVWLPMAPGDYAGKTTCAVLFDARSGPLVLCPLGTQAIAPPAPSAPLPSDTVTDTATIRPTWSGTWRAVRGDWDRWNAGRYGGRSTLWQGSAYGSGPLTGLATYGSQIVNLRAVAITAIRVNIVPAYGSGTVTVRGSSAGSKPSGAPPVGGSTASASGDVSLPADVREAMRTGATRGLALVGSTYLAVRGTSHPAGMSLTVTYTRRA